MDREQAGVRVAAGSDTYAEVLDWVYREAELLDDREEREWLETMVSRDIVYQVPIRQTVRRAEGDGFADGGFHLNESYGSLLVRVERNLSPSAWAEDPPPRTRRFVTNIRVTALGDGGLGVRSNLLVYRTWQDEPQPSLLAAQRRDALCRADGTLLLRRRLVLLDLTVLQVPNLSYFF